jgi:hypothetical protein
MYAITFGETAADHIAVVFAVGAVKEDGKEVSLEPFKFTKVTKWDSCVY